MAKTHGKCIFCDYVGELTSEHIISKRYHRFIPPTMGSYRTLRAVEFPDRSEYRVGKRVADPRDWKVKCVCHTTCNNGWMRKLDDTAAPLLTSLITGKAARLTPGHQLIIATWAVMKAIVAEYEDPHETTTHHMQRKSLFRNKRPPEGWAVWLGYFPRKRWTPTYALHPFQYVRPDILAKRNNPRATYYNASITTRVLGELFIQVVHAPIKFRIRDWRFPLLPNGGEPRRIWPPTTFSLKWPPPPMSPHDEEIATVALRDHIARNVRRN